MNLENSSRLESDLNRGVKRSFSPEAATEECQGREKRQRAEELTISPISTLLNEIVLEIFDYLRLRDLASIAQSSKRFKDLSDYAKVWWELCSKAKITVPSSKSPRRAITKALGDQSGHAQWAYAELFSENVYLPANLGIALQYYKLALAGKSLSSTEKLIVNLKRVRVKIDVNRDFDVEDGSYNQFLKGLSQHEAATERIRSEANFLRARVRYYRYRPEEYDAKIDQLLSGVTQFLQADTQYRNGADPLQAEVDYFRVKLRKKGCIPNMDDAQVDQLLKQLRDNEAATHSMRGKADFLRANLRYENRCDSLTDQQADQLFQAVSQNQAVSALRRAKAVFLRLDLFKNNRCDSLTSDQADQLLQAICQNQELSEWDRDQAAFWRVELRYENRCDSLTNQQADQLLQAVIQHGYCGLDAKAYLLSVKFSIQGRVSRLTDDQVGEILNNIINDQDASANTRREAMSITLARGNEPILRDALPLG